MRLFYIGLLLTFFHPSFSQQKISGFFPQHAPRQLAFEKEFDAMLSTSNQDEWMKFLTAGPHHIGSAKGKANAEYMATLFRQWGYETELAVYHVLFPTPKFRSLELLVYKPVS